MRNKYTKKQYLFILATTTLMIACNFNHKGNSTVTKKRVANNKYMQYIKPVFDSITIKKDIFFAEVTNFYGANEKLKLDVYSPAGDKEKSRPAILWVHGGGFSEGSKTQSYIVTLANQFAKKGYVCLSADYRLRKNPAEDITTTINDAVDDIMKALVWVRENSEMYGINKNQIIIGGGSAGGILSTNLCYRDGSDTLPWDKSGLIAFVNLWGSPDQNKMDKRIDSNDPPTIFVHGMADSIVPYNNCLWLSGLLDKADVKYKVFAIKGAGHTPVDHIDDIVTNIAIFLSEILSVN